MRKHIAITLLLAVGAAASAAASTTPDQLLQLALPGGPAAWATVPDQADLRPAADFSVEAWVRADPQQSLSAYPIVLTKPAGNLMNGECSYGFIAERANGHLHFRVTTTTGTFETVWNGNLLDGAWHHLAGVRIATGGSDLISLAVDGVNVATQPVSGATLFANTPLCIGASEFPGYSGNALVGKVDEVRLYTIARSLWAIDTQRAFDLSGGFGVAAVWHFDTAYPTAGGAMQILDSVKGMVLSTNGARLAPGTAPVSRSFAITQVDLLGQASVGSRSYLDAVRIAGARDVVSGQGFGSGPLNPSGWDELNVVNLTGTSRIQGTLAMPAGAPVVRMAARDSVVFCLRAVSSSGETWLHTLRVSDPAHPAWFGDSLKVKGNVKLMLDPTNPNLLIVAGFDAVAHENQVTFVDVTSAGAPVLQYDASLALESGSERLLDVAKRGAYVYASFSDGTIRIYRYDVFLFNGNWIRTLSRTTGTLAPYTSCALAVSGTRLFAADQKGTLQVYDLANPVAPTLLGTWNDRRSGASEVQVDGNQVAIGGPNGLTLVDASQPAAMTTRGYWCPDQRPVSTPCFTLRDGLAGLAAGIGGFSILSIGAPVTAVPPIASGAGPMTARPNPSRGRVDFELPASPGSEGHLEILDVTGRRVRTLEVSGSRGVWDGRGDSGTPAAAGVYLARWTTGARVHCARVVIVR